MKGRNLVWTLTVACAHAAAGALVGWTPNAGGRELLLRFDAPAPAEAAQASAWTLRGADVVTARLFANGTGVAVGLAEPLDTRSDYVLNGPGVANLAIRRPRPPGLPERLVRGAVEPPGAGSRRSAVSFTEVMVAPPTGGRDLRFAELYNSNPYPERIGGWSLSGAFKYTFPSGYTLAANAYVVVAADAAAVQAEYGVANVVQATKAETPFAKKLSLADERGGDLGSVKFADADPWPTGIGGTGHSLVLARPSYGWTVPEGWSRSAYPGGSPGRAEPPRPQGATRVLVNEVCPHGGDAEGFVELYNVSDGSAALAGCTIEVVGSGRPPFVFGFGRSIAPHRTLAVGEKELGFPLGGEGVEVVLRAPAASGGWIIDALRVAPTEIGRSVGRYPDGGPLVSRLVRPTRNVRNVARAESPVVLNEIMYHPITEGKDEEYVELFNPTDADVDLTGWKLTVDGKLGYAFVEKISAGGYLVLPKKKKVFKELYPDAAKLLTNDNCAESLSNSRGRLVLTRGLSVWSAAVGGPVEADVPMEEVDYRDGGAWGRWSDGGGSSLERVDPHADARLAGSWADSDESDASDWRTIEWTGPIELGRANDAFSVPDEVQFGLYDAGECLVDSVEVRAAGGPNLVKNASFEADDRTNDWRAFGTHAKSAIEAGPADDGARAYRLRACDRLSNGGNCVHGRLTASLPTSGTGTIRARVKWLAGSPDFLIRVRGNWIEASGDILSTRAMGTPGRTNSRASSSAPTISSVVHLPILPKAGETVSVWARVDAAAGVAGADLVWRRDGAAESRRMAMRSADGGWWCGEMPGAGADALVAFHVEVRGADAVGRTARYPETAEGLVRFGEAPAEGTFGVYRLWVTASEVERWYAQNRDSNEPRDMTFVAGNDRVIYGAGAEYGGSSWNGKSYPRPGTAASFIDYKADFPKDEPFLGDDGLVLATPGNRGNDKTGVKEQFAYALLRRLGRPSLHRRFVHVLFNGVAQNPMKIHEDTEKPNGAVLEHLFPDKDDGRLYKLDDWFEYDVNAFTNFTTDSEAARLAVHRGADGQYKTARYRWPWLPRACDNFQPSDYTAFFGLLDAVNAEPPLADEELEAVFNAQALAEVLAVNHFICNNDSYGYGRGKNMYLYEGPSGWEFVGWDMDYSFGDNGVSLTTTLDPTSPSFPCGDPVAKAILRRPVNLRRYWEAIRLCTEAADSSSPEYAEARAKFNALAADGAVVKDLEANFFAKMAERRTFAVEEVGRVAAVEGDEGGEKVAEVERGGIAGAEEAAGGVVEEPVAEPAAFGFATTENGRVVPRILTAQQPDATVTWWPCAGAASALGRLYVDSRIRLMPWGEDADPTEFLQSDERIQLWTQMDGDGRTNLFVTALQYDDDGWETYVGTNVFRIANSIDLSGELWRRLTVRAVADVTRAKARNPRIYPEGVQGFLVWLDGELLRTADGEGSFTDDYVNFLAYEPDPDWGWLDWENPVDREVANLLQSGTVFADLRGIEAGGVSDVGFLGSGTIDGVTVTTELAGFVSSVDFMLLAESDSGFAGVPQNRISSWLESVGATFAEAMTDAHAHASYLLNLGLGFVSAPQLKIVRMEPGEAGEWNVTVRAFVSDETVALTGGFNGRLAVRASATLEGLKTAEPVEMPFAFDATFREVTIRVNPRAGSFFRVTLLNL